MLTRHFECLLALDRERSIEKAAQACGLDRDRLLAVLRDAEQTYGRPLIRLSEVFDGFTPMGENVLAGARKVVGAADPGLQALREDADESSLLPLLHRRSVSPKRLGHPGPSAAQLDLILRTALCAPDHGALHPWRVIEFRPDTRPALAGLFEQEKLRRDPLASASDLRLAREHATRVPVLLAFVVSPRQRAKVPVREQWLAAGAALCNLLNAAHQLGFGAIMLSGERCHDAELVAQLGVQPDEFLAGFVSLGRVVQLPPERKTVLPGVVWSCWSPKACGDATASEDDASPAAAARREDD